MEALLAEDGMCVTAGLPEEMRRGLDRSQCGPRSVERGKAERERMEKLLASIGEHEARIKELQQELTEAMQAYKNVMLGTVAA